MASSCLLNYTLQGVAFDCNANLAGIKNVWLSYYDDATVELDNSAHTATVTLDTGVTWYKYSFARNSSSLN